MEPCLRKDRALALLHALRCRRRRLRAAEAAADELSNADRERHLFCAQATYIRFVYQQWSIIDALHKLLEETETYLLSLGFQPALTRRFCLERIETILAMVELGLAYGAVGSQCRKVRAAAVDNHLESARTATGAGSCRDREALGGRAIAQA